MESNASALEVFPDGHYLVRAETSITKPDRFLKPVRFEAMLYLYRFLSG
jgi:hypothetical protein